MHVYACVFQEIVGNENVFADGALSLKNFESALHPNFRFDVNSLLTSGTSNMAATS